MRRRRKTRYTWLPTLNGASFADENGAGSDRVVQQFVLDVSPLNNNVTGVIPVVADTPQGTLTTVSTEGIGEIIGNEYVLKRIVGKCFVYLDAQNNGGGDEPLDILEDYATVVTAGFFVARANPALITQPVDTPDANFLYSPTNNDNIRQPWIWRRTWILGFGGFGPGLTEDIGATFPPGTVIRGRGSFPQNNALYGSVQDGPHIDAKTGRRIRLEERLWFAVSAHRHNPTAVESEWNVTVQVTLDARYLGALRRPRGRSNFA